MDTRGFVGFETWSFGIRAVLLWGYEASGIGFRVLGGLRFRVWDLGSLLARLGVKLCLVVSTEVRFQVWVAFGIPVGTDHYGSCNYRKLYDAAFKGL